MDINLTQFIKKDSPDFNFTVFYKDKEVIRSDIMKWDSKNKHLRSVGHINTVFQMNDLMSKSLAIIDPDIFFSPDYPDWLLPTNNPSYKAAPIAKPRIITWSNVRKEPGTVGGKPFSGTQEIKPRIRECIAVFSPETSKWLIETSSISNDNNLTKYIKIRAQVFDNLVQYNCWSLSNYEVERLREWFELYMESYRGMFREAGVNEVVFNRQVRDQSLTELNNGYHVRSVLYYVRTERVLIDTLSPITRIDMNIDVNDLQALTKQLEDHNIDTDLYKNILSKWINK